VAWQAAGGVPSQVLVSAFTDRLYCRWVGVVPSRGVAQERQGWLADALAAGERWRVSQPVAVPCPVPDRQVNLCPPAVVLMPLAACAEGEVTVACLGLLVSANENISFGINNL
jgi:hypothetical protein